MLKPSGRASTSRGNGWTRKPSVQHRGTGAKTRQDVAVLAPGHWIDRKIAVSKAEREELAVLASQEVVEGRAIFCSNG